MERYLDFRWNAEDLIECKSMAYCLYYSYGIELEVLRTLNFGCLDLEAALFED